MIIKKEDIQRFRGVKVDNDLYLKRTANIHKPTGVFFEQYQDNETYEFMYFVVAAIDDLGEIVDRKVFEGQDENSFFKAVDYFEKLIEERIPEEKNDPPSIGIFCYIKRDKKMPCFVDIGLQENITIDDEDLEKVFTPPRKKPFGRLNMLAVDKPKYDVIKSKFALNFDKQLTTEYADKFDLPLDDIFVYKLTPYQNEPQNQNEPEQEPEDVNEEQLSLNDIEDEDPQEMKGDKDKDKKKDKDKGEDKSSEDSGNEDNSKSDENKDDSDENKDDSDEGDSDSDEGDSDSDEGDSDEGDSDESDSDEGDKGSDKTDDSDKTNEDENPNHLNERKPGDEIHSKPFDTDIELEHNVRYIKNIPSDTIVDKLNQYYESENLIKGFRKQERLISTLNTFSQEEIENNFYENLGIAKGTPKKDFIEIVKIKTKPYFEK
jgi:hypothetical protein